MDATFPGWFYPIIFMGAALVSASTARAWIHFCLRIGLVDRPGPRKIHANPIPLAGGLIVATGLLVPLVIAALVVKSQLLGPQLTALSSYGLNARTLQLIGLIVGALGMLTLGLIDDRGAMSAGKKLIFQILIVGFVAGTGTRITLFIPSPLFSYAITILWFLTLVNAFNFNDNMNGLCSGLATISALALAIHSVLPDHYLVASLGFLIAGAVCGYIPFNYPKAQTFLGDAGSHLIGYLIAALAILPHFHHDAQPNKFGVISPLLVLGMVLVDLCWIVSYRIYHRKPVYIGDTNHLSHQLVRRGFTPQKAVVILWVLHAIIAASSFLLVLRPG